VFTVGAQEYFAEKGYTEDPKLCKACYMQKKREKKGFVRNGHVEHAGHPGGPNHRGT
jgi:hypothetical protein